MLASGALGLISIPGEPRRLTREEIDARYPALIDGLVDHPEIGFVLVRSADGSSLVLGDCWEPQPAHRRGRSATTRSAPFGPDAVDQVREVDGYRTVADLMVNSRYDPDLDEVAAFEHQVGSHGALGGPADPSVRALSRRPQPHRPSRSSARPPCTACSRVGWPTSAIRSRPRGEAPRRA